MLGVRLAQREHQRPVALELLRFRQVEFDVVPFSPFLQDDEFLVSPGDGPVQIVPRRAQISFQVRARLGDVVLRGFELLLLVFHPRLKFFQPLALHRAVLAGGLFCRGVRLCSRCRRGLLRDGDFIQLSSQRFDLPLQLANRRGHLFLFSRQLANQCLLVVPITHSKTRGHDRCSRCNREPAGGACA